MNELELRAYGSVAQAVARHAFAMAEGENEDNRDAFPDAPRPIYYHWSTSTFEAVADNLWRLRILRPLDQKSYDAYHFVFDCEVSVSNVVAERNAPNGPTLFELLVTFVDLFGDFGTEYWGFSTKQGVAFGAGGRIEPTLEALASIGYLTRTEGGHVWTELIAPVMRASYNFDDWPDPAADGQLQPE
jgi:hypothetical protein